MSRGKFITLEGGEGVGKSTAMAAIADELSQADIAFVQTREPGGTPLGEELRGVLLTPRDDTVSADAELLLMFAARAEHIAKVIEPALSAGTWVVSDRFTDASYAYQGGGRGIEDSRIDSIERWVQSGLQPDLTLLFDASIELSRERLKRRAASDRIENENNEFFEKVRRAYLMRAQAFPDRFRMIDASQSLQGVDRDVRQQVQHVMAAATE
ncbi:MAG: dTMP kinase [Pseudomonadota bacterium]